MTAVPLEAADQVPLYTGLLTYDEAAAYARVSRSTLSRAVAAGELHCGSPTGARKSHKRFRREDLDRWLGFDEPREPSVIRPEPMVLPVDPRSRKRRAS